MGPHVTVGEGAISLMARTPGSPWGGGLGQQVLVTITRELGVAALILLDLVEADHSLLLENVALCSF